MDGRVDSPLIRPGQRLWIRRVWGSRPEQPPLRRKRAGRDREWPPVKTNAGKPSHSSLLTFTSSMAGHYLRHAPRGANAFNDKPQFQGFMKPCRYEGEVQNLEVFGEIPTEVDGTFYRVMPDPQFAPFIEDDPVSLLGSSLCIWLTRFVSGSMAMATSAPSESMTAESISSNDMSAPRNSYAKERPVALWLVGHLAVAVHPITLPWA